MIDEEYEKELNKKEYLVKYKDYKTCISCGELISPKDLNYEISFCRDCEEHQMRERG